MVDSADETSVSVTTSGGTNRTTCSRVIPAAAAQQQHRSPSSWSQREHQQKVKEREKQNKTETRLFYDIPCFMNLAWISHAPSLTHLEPGRYQEEPELRCLRYDRPCKHRRGFLKDEPVDQAPAPHPFKNKNGNRAHRDVRRCERGSRSIGDVGVAMAAAAEQKMR